MYIYKHIHIYIYIYIYTLCIYIYIYIYIYKLLMVKNLLIARKTYRFRETVGMFIV